MNSTINLLDNVRVTPTSDSAHVIKTFAGRVGTVFSRKGGDLGVVLAHGVRLCLRPEEAQRLNGWDDRKN